MEPRNTGTGNVAADQSAAAETSTQGNLGNAATTQDKKRTTTQDSATFSGPGNQNQQTGNNKSDGR
ncbi:MAG: hypothetical protein ABR987_01230 [Terracidiphilus sp.]|jgi:hypothetical protein